MKMVSDFSTRVKEMISTLHVSQQQIADRTGISKATISRYVKGNMEPKVETLNQIAKTFGINPVWLIGYDVCMFKTVAEEKIESNYPYYLEKLNIAIEGLTEGERETAYNVLKSIFPNKIK